MDAPPAPCGYIYDQEDYVPLLFTRAKMLEKIRAYRANPGAHRDYVSPEQLAAFLRAEGGSNLPPEIVSYVADILDRKVRKPKGRPPEPSDQWMTDMGSQDIYALKLAKLQAMSPKALARVRRSLKRTSAGDWNDNAPPAELALRIVQQRFYPTITWESLRTRLANFKKIHGPFS